MLTIHESDGKPVWVDLCEPTPEELAKACADYDLDIPPGERLYEDGVFTLSVPVTPHHKDESEDETSPLGFVLTKDLLVTIRFSHLHTFPAVIKRFERPR